LRADVVGYGFSLFGWMFFAAGLMITVILAPLGFLGMLVAPVGALFTRRWRRCEGCRMMWPPRKDWKRAVQA
jgi:hypothetical protein